MSAGGWSNNDELLLQYGTAKAAPHSSGGYQMPGPNRITEVLIDLSTLITANATIVDLNTFIPSMANFYVEKVELVSETAMSTGSSPTLSIGVCGTNLNYSGGTTVTYGTVYTNTGTAQVPTNGGTAFVSAIPAASLAAGSLVVITTGGSSPIGADSYIGNYVGDYEDTTNLTYPMYLTATLGTHTATGMIRCRIFYHGVGTIPN